LSLARQDCVFGFLAMALALWFGLLCFAIWKESRAQLRIKKQHELISCWIEKAVEKI